MPLAPACEKNLNVPAFGRILIAPAEGLKLFYSYQIL